MKTIYDYNTVYNGKYNNEHTNSNLEQPVPWSVKS